MKTLNEVIDQLTECHTNWARWSENSDIVDRSAVDDALSYLRMYKELADDSEAFAEWKENPPLTWEELKQMEGKPVWVEYESCDRKVWAIIDCFYTDVFKKAKMNVALPHDYWNLEKEMMGVTWQAYRKELS